MSLTAEEATQLSQLYAFLGNSLLKPMSQTETIGLKPEFWAGLPSFGSDSVSHTLDELFAFAQAVEKRASEGEDVVTEVSVEYTRLFIGPPSPAAPPWETYYPEHEEREVNCGFGEATFDMRRRLREVGLSVQNENHQYEDHMGIELLYLSVLCKRAASGESTSEDVCAFIEEHPLAWIGRFKDKVAAAAPGGYYQLLLELAQATMTWHVRE